jgi:signal transduction histidine kinase/ligand-binding sensor domain-containing protein
VLITALALGTPAPCVGLDPTTALSRYARASWTETDGLPSSLIWAITQDRDGYLWLGTGAGVIRFDGVRFVRWNDLGHPPLVPGTVFSLLAARDGSLWIGSGGSGVSRFRDGALTHYAAPAHAVPASVIQLLEGPDGTIWAGGRGGLAKFSGASWTAVDTALREHTVTGLFLSRDGTLWAATSAGLFRRAEADDRLQQVTTNFLVRSLTETPDGQVWGVSPELAAAPIAGADGERAQRRWRDVNGWRPLVDRDGNLWVGTLGRGVLRISPSDRGAEGEWMTAGPRLTGDVVRSLFEDREGNLWIGTQNGLNRLSDNRIAAIAHSDEVSQPVRALTAGHDGSIWVGTDNGVYRFDGETRTHFGRNAGLPSVVTGALHRDQRGVMWAAMDQGGLARFVDGRFVREPIPTTSPLQRVWAMTSDASGALWLCEVDRGIFRWSEGVLTGFGHVAGLRHKFPVAALTASDGRLWFGFSDGTLAVHDGGRFDFFTAADGLAGGRINVLYEDAHRVIWIGSDAGLSRHAAGRFTSLTAKTGLPDGSVRSMVQDTEHNMWIGVSTGLIRLDPREYERAVNEPRHSATYARYDMHDGLPGVPMSGGGYPTAALARDGALWFVTSNGLAVVDPRRLATPRPAPPVRIESVLADGRLFRADADLRLPPRQSTLEIDYTGLGFAAPAKIRFKYRLDGFERTWTDAGTRRQAFYTNLPPGDYVFRVLASNGDSSDESGASWRFSIAPTFYQTGWFYMLGVTVLGLMVAAAWHGRTRQVRRQFALVLAERARMAWEIHETLLQSLVGVAFQFDTLAAELDTPEVAGRRVERLRSQVETYIREARQSIWDLRSPILTRTSLGAALRDLGEKITGKTVEFICTATGTPPRRNWRVEQTLLRIGQEAISNAVRHAEATRVVVQVEYQDDAVLLTIRDDGRGFRPDSVGPTNAGHWGLANMRERAAHIGASFSLVSEPGRGTSVEVRASLLHD